MSAILPFQLQAVVSHVVLSVSFLRMVLSRAISPDTVDVTPAL
jgi:hypothetical protein